MSCSFARADTDKKKERKRPPVTCKFYDAQSAELGAEGWKRETVFKMCTELSNYEKKSPASYLLLDQEPTSFVNTVIGNVPVGSYMGCQLFDIDKEAVEFVFERT